MTDQIAGLREALVAESRERDARESVALRLEQAYHRRFSLHRAEKREWYHPSEVIMDHVKMVREAKGERLEYLTLADI